MAEVFVQVTAIQMLFWLSRAHGLWLVGNFPLTITILFQLWEVCITEHWAKCRHGIWKQNQRSTLTDYTQTVHPLKDRHVIVNQVILTGK